MFAKIENENSYVKDMNTGAIILVDKGVHENYIRERAKVEKEKKIHNEVVSLRNEIKELKEILKRLIPDA